MTHRERGASASAGVAPIAYLPWVRHDDEPSDAAPDVVAISSDDVLLDIVSDIASAEAESGFLTEEFGHEIEAADRADALVLRQLARRGMSQREVERELARELDVAQITTAVQRYIRLGYIDDDRLGEHIVQAQRDRKGKGSAGVRRELESRGIPAAVITRVLGDLDGDEELARATELAVDRLRRVATEPDDVQRRRLSGFLMRRGYSGSVANAAITAALRDSRE